jgi:hypothetical protein
MDFWGVVVHQIALFVVRILLAVTLQSHWVCIDTISCLLWASFIVYLISLTGALILCDYNSTLSRVEPKLRLRRKFTKLNSKGGGRFHKTFSC